MQGTEPQTIQDVTQTLIECLRADRAMSPNSPVEAVSKSPFGAALGVIRLTLRSGQAFVITVKERG